MTHWAENFIGKPWVNGAEGPDAYDCFGVVKAVYRDQLGLAVKTVDVDALRALDVARAMRDYDYSEWDQVAAPDQEFDVVEMSLNRRPHHVGVFVGGGVLTSVEGIGVIHQSLSSLKRHGWNITNVYRRKAD